MREAQVVSCGACPYIVVEYVTLYTLVAPTISKVVQQLKGYVSKEAGIVLWQKSFFDHVIRNQKDYEAHLRYMYENPIRWCSDELYVEE